MNVLINFRYLNGSSIDQDIVHQVIESDELQTMVDGFKVYSEGIRQMYDIDTYYLKSNGAINSKRVKDAKKDITKICNVKAIPIEDPEEYVNFEDVKRRIQEAVQNIADYDGDEFDLKTFNNVFYLVYIDIIEKYSPLNIFCV